MNSKIHCLRLTEGQDLKQEIQKFVGQKGLRSGVILSAVGSLKQARLRLAQAQNFAERTECFEIVSMTGTLSQDGVHLHISLADAKGAVWGGHLVDGCVIYTTCELVLMEIEGAIFTREHDPKTGYKEIVFGSAKL